MKKYSSATVWIIATILLFFAASFLLKGESSSDRIVFSDFQQKWINNEIESVKVDPDKMLITGETRDDKNFTVYSPDSMVEMLNSQYPKNDIKIEYIAPSNNSIWLSIIPSVLIIILFLVFIFFFTQQSQGGGSGKGVMNFGKSRAKMMSPDAKKVTFDDVAGADEEKAELEEIVDFLKSPSRYTEMGARIPKGVLLVGPPGTGKTLLAKAIAGEAGVPFFSISGSDFVEMFVGVGASRVRDLFEQAKKNSPAIVFIDEIDAVGRKRGAGLGGGHDEREQTLNQLLVEMDGFGINEGVIVVAATNRADILDPALLRPGRFDRQVVVGRPDVKGRESILKVHAKGKPLNEDVDLKVIARTTPGFTGADLANLMNEAALLTARHNKRAIDMEEVQKAFIKITVGTEKKSHLVTDKEKRITAFHEVGHALIHELLDTLDPVHSVSIIPTGFAGGYTMPLPKEDKLYMTKTRMLDEIVSLLGGRAAEELVFGDITTGASNDIERATNIARDMVTKYGMSELGPIKFGDEQEEVFLGRDFSHQRNYSEDVATAIDQHIRSIVENAYSRSKQLLTEHMDTLNRASEVLLAKEKITGHEFRKIMRGEDVDMEVVDEQSIFEMAQQMEKVDQEEAEREL